MALQISFNTNMGFTQNNAYARIENYNGNKESIQVNVIVYHCGQCRVDRVQPLGYISVGLDLPDGATMEQMYAALKLDSNFIGAVDC